MLKNPSEKELFQEEQQLAWLRQFTTLIAARLRTENLTETEAVCLLEAAKKAILDRFPDKEEAYTLIYERRFKRILQKRGILLPLSPPGKPKSLS